jgi:ABC-type antimicrobial peptide transport system permease subunit
LNTCIVGNYEVTYICYNSSGNYSTKVIVIEVIDDLGVENNQKEEVVDKNDKEELENSKNPISNENDKDVENNNELDFLFKTIDVNSKVVFDFILVILIIILLIIIFKKRN